MPKVAPYFLFMKEFKQEKERELGRSLNMDFQAEVSQMASDSWNSMSDNEKAYYKEKSKGGSVSGSRPNRTGQLTTHGVPVSVYDEAERQKRFQEENMRRRVGSMIQTIPLLSDFLSHPIFFMYGNYFYKNGDGKYSPAELAMCKFTFRDGVINGFHTFINPGKVELGYAYTAKEHSESTHRLPPPPNAFGEENFGRLFYEIKKFLTGDNDTSLKAFDGGNPIVFAYADPYASEDNQMDVLKSFMEQFCPDGPSNIDLYPLTRLFYALHKELSTRGRCDEIPNENFSNVFLSRDPYETIGGISCKYHEEKDATQHCALSRVRRWTFLMADHFCERLGVQLVPGSHLPKNADVPRALSSLGSASGSTSGSVSGSVSASDNESVTSDTKESSEDEVRSLRGPGSSSASGSIQQPTRKHGIGSSVSTLNCDVQSIQTSSSVADVGGRGRGTLRRSRASLVNSLPRQTNSSTFYNP